MLSILLFQMMCSLPCWARLVNVTIDDMYGDVRTGLKPEYSPGWDGFSVLDPHLAGNKWDAAQIHNGTLHFPDPYSKTGGNVSLTFEGTTICVFFVDSFVDDPSADSAVFYMDDDSVPVGRYLSTPVDGARYNILALKRDGLSQSRHQLLMHFLPKTRSFFDYAIYTMDDLTGSPPVQSTGSQSPEHPASTGTGDGHATNATGATQAIPSSTDMPIRSSATHVDSASRILPSVAPSQTPLSRVSPHAPLNLRLIVSVPTVCGTLAAVMCAWFLLRRRRRVREDAVPAQAQAGDPITPFTTQPGSASEVSTARKWRRTGTQTNLSRSPTAGMSDSQNLSIVATPTGASSKSQPADLPAQPLAGDVMAELERVRAESERAQSAYESVRAEIQMLRQALAPPPYPVAD